MESNYDEIKRAFENKDGFSVYIPLLVDIASGERYIIELLDLLDAYLQPMEYGINKNDILEYLIEPCFKEYNLFEFLRYRKYVATQEDFIDLFLSYSNPNKSESGNIIYQGLEITLQGNQSFQEREYEHYISKLIHKLLSGVENLETEYPNIKRIYIRSGIKKVNYL